MTLYESIKSMVVSPVPEKVNVGVVCICGPDGTDL